MTNAKCYSPSNLSGKELMRSRAWLQNRIRKMNLQKCNIHVYSSLGEKNVFVRNLFDKKLFIKFPKLTLLEILYQYHEKYALKKY